MKKHDVPDALLASLLADYKKPNPPKLTKGIMDT